MAETPPVRKPRPAGEARRIGKAVRLFVEETPARNEAEEREEEAAMGEISPIPKRC